MIRVCNGEVFNITLEEFTSENLNVIFHQLGHRIKIQIVDGNNKFVGMSDYEACISSQKMDTTCIKLNPDFLKNSKKIFMNYTKEYLPVVNNEYELECFCYDDNLNWDYYNYQLLLMDPQIAKKVFEDYSRVDIWGFNEFSIRLAYSLRNAGIPFRVCGEFWADCGISGNCTKEEKGENIYVFRSEGNQGISLCELGFWKNDLPPEEYEVIENKLRALMKNGEIMKNRPAEASVVHNVIGEAIKNKVPFCVSRMGHTEAQIVGCKENDFYDKTWLQWLYTTAGFFSKGEAGSINLADVDDYVKRTIAGIKNADVNIMFGEHATAYLVNKYASDHVINASMDEVGIINSSSDYLWTLALEGKKVLVISAMSDTIRQQYQIKDKLHSRKVLPDFELITLRAHETQLYNKAGFEDWWESYECLLEKVGQIDFDVALISAGAYGYPLASDIKNMGKIAVELCSNLAPLFGIKMKRHDVRYEFNKHWNEYWTYPVEQGPAGRDIIEYGCYWRG